MAAQHKVARAVSESFVIGRELKVLIEGAASAKQLRAAQVSSWEHGLVREKRHRWGHCTLAAEQSRRWLPRTKPTRRTLTAGFMCVAVSPPAPSPV